MISPKTLRFLRKNYKKLGGKKKYRPIRTSDPNKASEMILDILKTGCPCMIARYGATELAAVVNHIGVNHSSHSVVDYIKGVIPEWWWDEKGMKMMENNAGFFPANSETLTRFGELMMEDGKQLDFLASWLSNERFIEGIESIPKATLLSIEPWWSNNPWTQWLKGKKVLVVHPFAELMKKQYELKRESLFLNPMVLPEFGELTVIKAVQSLGGGNTEFSNWFEALNSMKAQMDSIDYDVCLIGCGAYGFPLAAHAKRTGHQAIHLGGVLQLLFGIKGKRWEDPNYNNRYNYTTLFNDSWVKPGEDLKPSNYRAVEGGCYW